MSYLYEHMKKEANPFASALSATRSKLGKGVGRVREFWTPTKAPTHLETLYNKGVLPDELRDAAILEKQNMNRLLALFGVIPPVLGIGATMASPVVYDAAKYGAKEGYNTVKDYVGSRRRSSQLERTKEGFGKTGQAAKPVTQVGDKTPKPKLTTKKTKAKSGLPDNLNDGYQALKTGPLQMGMDQLAKSAGEFYRKRASEDKVAALIKTIETIAKKVPKKKTSKPGKNETNLLLQLRAEGKYISPGEQAIRHGGPGLGLGKAKDSKKK